MKNYNQFPVLFALFAFLQFFPASASAAIAVDSFQGSLLITLPDGSVKLVDSGEPLPEIQEQSTLEVFEGQFTLSAGEGEKVRVACGGNEAEVSGPASVTLSCSQTGGLLKVEQGTAHLTEISGEERDVNAGQEVALSIVDAKKAEPVAAPDDNGTPVEPSASEPDSRSIDASVSQ